MHHNDLLCFVLLWLYSIQTTVSNLFPWNKCILMGIKCSSYAYFGHRGLKQCVNSLWPCDQVTPYSDIEMSETLVKVMACRLTAPRHYMYKCWLSSVKTCGVHLSLCNKFAHYFDLIVDMCLRVQWVKSGNIVPDDRYPDSSICQRQLPSSL